MATATERSAAALALALCGYGASARAQTDRPFLFASDTRTPRMLQGLATYRVTWGAAGNGALRPIGAGALGQAGFLHELGGEMGLNDRLSLRLYGVLSDPSTSGLGGPMTGTFGGELRGRLWSSVDQRHQLTVSVGALRELSGALAFQARVVGSMRFGALRLVGDVLLERSTRRAADGVDVVVVAGASYALRPWLRAGVEYVGQDLEALWDDEEIEGARHMAGPVLALVSERHGLQFVAGPAFGLSSTSPGLVVRAGLQYAFR
jgi:hypothetical protein